MPHMKINLKSTFLWCLVLYFVRLFKESVRVWRSETMDQNLNLSPLSFCATNMQQNVVLQISLQPAVRLRVVGYDFGRSRLGFLLLLIPTRPEFLVPGKELAMIQ